MLTMLLIIRSIQLMRCITGLKKPYFECYEWEFITTIKFLAT